MNSYLTHSVLGFFWIACGSLLGPARADQPIGFERIQLSDEFYAEGAAMGDFNSDGSPDVVSGPWIYWGPNLVSSSRIYEGDAFNPVGYSKNFVMDVSDVDTDGDVDIFVVGFPGEESSWFENPGVAKSKDLWQKHVILEVVDNESPWIADIDSNGTLDLVCSSQGHYGYASHAGGDPRQPWTFHKVSPNNKYHRFTHGLGVGDVNNDGTQDLLEKDGWWENPGKPTDDLWTFHRFPFSPNGGSQMFAVDLDGDGKNEVVTGLAAHGYGLVYFKATDESAADFQRFDIMTDDSANSPVGLAISQLHAVAVGDVNRDQVPDIVTGKRWWAHAGGDPGGEQPATLLWIETKRLGQRVQFEAHVVDNSSGVGTDVKLGDANGDGLLDILSGTKRGTYLFLQRPSNLGSDKHLLPDLVAKDQFGQRMASEVVAATDGGFVPAIDGRALNFDFDATELTDWEARGPAGRAAQEAIAEGNSAIDTGSNNPKAIGEIISRPFRLSKPRLSLTIDGTNQPEKLFAEVVSEQTGQRLVSASPQKPEAEQVMLEVTQWVGENVRVRIVDYSNAGFIRCDQIRLHD